MNKNESMHTERGRVKVISESDGYFCLYWLGRGEGSVLSVVMVDVTSLQ